LNNPAQVAVWANKGWVDLHPKNLARWKDRFMKMMETRTVLRHGGSAASNIRTYMGDSLEIGEVVAWIFNNEMGGHRVK
jgi:hypothetical protein